MSSDSNTHPHIVQELKSLHQKRIVVTAAGSDVGTHLSLRLASAGAEIILLDRRQGLIAPLYDQIGNAGHPEPMMVALDQTKASESNLTSLADQLSSEFSHLNGLIHLPLTAAPLTPVLLSDPQIWAQTWDLLFLKPALLTKALLPLLIQGSDSSVVFSSLQQGREGKAYWAAVGPALAALENLCQVLADEHEDVRFNTIDPGKVAYAIRHKYFPAEAKSTLLSVDDPIFLDCFVNLIAGSQNHQSGTGLTALNK